MTIIIRTVGVEQASEVHRMMQLAFTEELPIFLTIFMLPVATATFVAWKCL
jgi:hypothetical protein